MHPIAKFVSPDGGLLKETIYTFFDISTFFLIFQHNVTGSIFQHRPNPAQKKKKPPHSVYESANQTNTNVTCADLPKASRNDSSWHLYNTEIRKCYIRKNLVVRTKFKPTFDIDTVAPFNVVKFVYLLMLFVIARNSRFMLQYYRCGLRVAVS